MVTENVNISNNCHILLGTYSRSQMLRTCMCVRVYLALRTCKKVSTNLRKTVKFLVHNIIFPQYLTVTVHTDIFQFNFCLGG